jgi:hypothetical protein
MSGKKWEKAGDAGKKREMDAGENSRFWLH